MIHVSDARFENGSLLMTKKYDNRCEGRSDVGMQTYIKGQLDLRARYVRRQRRRRHSHILLWRLSYSRHLAVTLMRPPPVLLRCPRPYS
jgi:hypothetical protein